jgi:hypothetical protein
VIDAERLAASIAVELIAAGAEQRTASCARAHFQEDVPAIFVVFDREAFEECVAGGAGGGSELLSHVNNDSLALSYCQMKFAKQMTQR